MECLGYAIWILPYWNLHLTIGVAQQRKLDLANCVKNLNYRMEAKMAAWLRF